jgi:hypothetical protein
MFSTSQLVCHQFKNIFSLHSALAISLILNNLWFQTMTHGRVWVDEKSLTWQLFQLYH